MIEKTEMDRNKVVILLDGSEFRRKILPYVKRFIRPEDNELILFRVGDLPQPVHVASDLFYIDLHLAANEQSHSEITVQLRDELLATKGVLEEAGYAVSREVRLGNVARRIEEYIMTNDIDLVAMTTHGRTGISKALYGSIAEHILRHVTIPMLLLCSPD